MIQLHDKYFVHYLGTDTIQQISQRLADQIYDDHFDKSPIFIGVLSGAFLFLSDLIRNYAGYCHVDFVKFRSYSGTESTGKVSTLLDFPEIKGKDVVIVEDIVDTGRTLQKIIERVEQLGARSYKVASLFFKPEAYQFDRSIDYIGKNIPDKFIVGYGLDYDGLGRNLPDIYQLKK
jgi:hypoxanthine phosphoribosyltransferase